MGPKPQRAITHRLIRRAPWSAVLAAALCVTACGSGVTASEGPAPGGASPLSASPTSASPMSLPVCDASSLTPHESREPLFAQDAYTTTDQPDRIETSTRLWFTVTRSCTAPAWSLTITADGSNSVTATNSKLGATGVIPAGEDLAITVRWHGPSDITKTTNATIDFSGVTQRIGLSGWTGTDVTWSGPQKGSEIPRDPGTASPQPTSN